MTANKSTCLLVLENWQGRGDHGNNRGVPQPQLQRHKGIDPESRLDHAPRVTRQKPTDPYTIKNGGNTWLAILNELWQETGDRRLYEFDGIFCSWTDDLDMIVGHRVENGSRAHMHFTERAIAAATIRDYIDRAGQKAVSTSEVARRFKALDWSTSKRAGKELGLDHYSKVWWSRFNTCVRCD